MSLNKQNNGKNIIGTFDPHQRSFPSSSSHETGKNGAKDVRTIAAKKDSPVGYRQGDGWQQQGSMEL